MADFDEEIRRQAAIASLLARDDSGDSYAASMAPEVIKPDTQEDYHKLIDQAFPKIAEDQPQGPPKLAPTPIVSGLVTDPESGSRYVKDPTAESGVVPYAEPATPADEEAFKPGQVDLPKSTVLGPAPRAQLVDPDPDRNYFELNQADKPVPGFIESSKNAIVNPAAGVIKPDPTQGNFGDEEFARSILAGAPSRVKPIPGFVEKSQNAIVNPAAGVVQPTAPKADIAQDPIVTRSIAQNIAAQSASAPAPVQTPAQTQVTQPTSNDDYNKLMDSFFPSADKTKATSTNVQPDVTGQDNTGVADYFRKQGEAPITDENDPRLTQINIGGSKWNVHREAAPYFQGFLKELADQGAPMRSDGGWNYRNKVGASGLSEHSWAGAIDVNQDGRGIVTPAFQQWIQDHPGALQQAEQRWHIYGGERFGDLGHFEWGGVGGQVSKDQAPEEPPINTLVKLDQSGVNVTHFGYEKPGEEGYDADSANGNGKYVKDLIPGYDVALNSESAALVGNPKPGETFQFAGKEWRYGDQASDKLKGPRFDIFDPSGTALTGSMPVGRQVAVNAPAKDKMPWDSWTPLSPADQAAAEKEGLAFRTQQISVLDKLNQSTKNPKQFWDLLQNRIEGVTDGQRQAYAENWKKEITQSAVDFYSQKGTLAEQHVEPEEAFKKAVSDPGFDAYIGNIGRGLAGAAGEADIGIALAGKAIDRNRADGFMNLVHPDSTGEGRAGFLKSLTDIQDKNQRHKVFNQIYGDLPQNTKDAIGDPVSILDSIDNLADPARQADLNKRIAAKKAWVDQQLAGDPSLKGTSAGWWTTGTGENLFNTVAALIPGGVGAVVRTSTLGAQMYSSNMDRIAAEHPDWSGEKVSDEASKSAFLTLAPSEAVLALSHGLTAPLLKWAGSLAEKPIVRFGIGGGVQVGAAGVGGALGQVGANVAENKPLLQDVPQAAGSAIVQSLPFAIHGGLGALGHEPVVKAPEPVASEHGPVVGPAADYVIQHPEERTSSTVGPEEGPLLPKTFEVPIKGEMHGPAFGQLYPEPIEGDEHGPAAFARNVFTPAELRSKIEDLAGGNFSPEQLRQEIANLQPDNLTLQPEIARGLAPAREPVTLPEAIRKAKADAVAAKLGGTPPQPTQGVKPRPVAGDFPTPAHAAVYQDLVSRGMDESHTRFLVSRAKGTTEAEILTDVQTQMRANGTTPPPKPGNISGEEPWAQHEANKSTVNGVINELTKGVANKYAEERMKAGELGPIDPNTGLTTEALMARASKMRPQEVQDHINNFMENRGGDPRDHAAAVRTREAFLTDRNRALSLKAETNPHDLFAQSDAAVARKALNDFYVKGGPISRMKETFHVHGVGLQGEPSIDLSTYGGLHDKFLRETGKPPPPGAKPRLKKAAERVRTTHSDEYKARDKVDKAIDKDGRKKIPSIEEVRDYIAKRMTQMPCRK